MRWLLLLAYNVALGCAQGPTAMQNGGHPQGTPDAPAYVLHENVQEVLLYCTVLDRHGTLLTDLDRSAFKAYEDKKLVTITHFDHKDVPVSLALVLDDSGSMRQKRSAVQSAAVDLIKASNPADETSVTNFADSAYLDQDFTSDLSSLQSALGKSKTVSGGTALFDTVIEAADHLAKDSHHSKQVIVVVTDGRDNASVADLPAAIRRVQTADGPVIYTIGLLFDVPGPDARHAHHDLQALSDETGGIAFFPASVNEVDKIAAEVARDIRNQYTIGYRPPLDPSTNSYRSIALKATAPGRPNLIVRTRKGYLRLQSSTPAH